MPSTPLFVIQGLAGAKKLRGTVSIKGAKNAALKAMAAAVLFDGSVTLENVPANDDVQTLSTILTKLGASVERKGMNTIVIDPSKLNSTDIDATLAGSMRASVVLTGPLLGRFGSATFPAPGGCVIGARPIDLFIKGYEKMGVTTDLDKDACIYHMKSAGKLKAAEIFFAMQTVGGTETLMMAAVLAEGRTILKNCAMEPEIASVAEWLNACGAKISGAGTTTIEIEGTNGKLLSPKVPYVTIPDRIETGSFLLLGALCAEELEIKECDPRHLESLISMLEESGVPLKVTASKITISKNVKPASSFKPLSDVRTHEYPGFPTDLQAPLVTLLTQVTGESKVLETIYEGRFKYVAELAKLGANITVMNPREILIKGPTSLRAPSKGEAVVANDIRAGFAVVMAALTGTGTFTVTNVQLIDRGYEKLEERLKALGADITRKQ